MARIAQVKEFNSLVIQYGIDRAYIMTTGAGSMFDKPRVKGWVVFEHPKLDGVGSHEFAKWFSNKDLALADWGERC